MRNTVILVVAVAALGLASCSTTPRQAPTAPASPAALDRSASLPVASFTPAQCYVPRPRGGDYRYSGGPGDRPETAILIQGVQNGLAGVDAEYAYVSRHLRGWKVCGQALLNPGNRIYDQLLLQDPSGTPRSIHFDITEWFGKGMGLP
ncbi:CubicO group peptidase (beta-lactamase class C family) [Inquilinus ginsengisoli]|uniref:hypothetical protein n=1 Tax=Inquilinus ginsengisoli TaxID=363840 RepID=UPI003D1A2786